MKFRLLSRPTHQAQTQPAARASDGETSDVAGTRLTPRQFLKAAAVAGIVGAVEAVARPDRAEADYHPGSPNDTVTTNLLVQGNVVVGPSYSATNAVAITQAMSGSSLIAGLANTPSLTYTGSTTIPNAMGISTKPTVTINAPVTSYSGLQVDTTGLSVGTGSLTNHYGIYVTTPTGATNNFPLYVQGGVVYLGGSVGVGQTTPGLKLEVNGPSGYPANSGSTQIGILRLSQSGGVVLDMGVSGASPYGGWLQATKYTLLSSTFALLLNPNGGNVGIGMNNPSASLSIAAPGTTELGGAAPSTTLRANAGVLASTASTELPLASVGYVAGNQVSLGVRARRNSTGSDWTTTAIGLGLDVDNTARAGPALWLAATGNVGIASGTFQAAFVPAAALHLNTGIFQIASTKIADSSGCYYA
jgi:hypothetical protein